MTPRTPSLLRQEKEEKEEEKEERRHQSGVDEQEQAEIRAYTKEELTHLCTWLLRLFEFLDKIPKMRDESVLHVVKTMCDGSELCRFLAEHASHDNECYSWECIKTIEILIGLYPEAAVNFYQQLAENWVHKQPQGNHAMYNYRYPASPQRSATDRDRTLRLGSYLTNMLKLISTVLQTLTNQQPEQYRSAVTNIPISTWFRWRDWYLKTKNQTAHLYLTTLFKLLVSFGEGHVRKEILPDIMGAVYSMLAEDVLSFISEPFAVPHMSMYVFCTRDNRSKITT